MTQFSEREESQHAAKVAKAERCDHDWYVFLPTCLGFNVGPDIEYVVHECRHCDARGDVCMDSGAVRAYVPALPNERLKTQDGAFYGDRDIYEPQHNGIDAALDTREPMLVNLFDKRGGRGGIGD